MFLGTGNFFLRHGLHRDCDLWVRGGPRVRKLGPGWAWIRIRLDSIFSYTRHERVLPRALRSSPPCRAIAEEDRVILECDRWGTRRRARWDCEFSCAEIPGLTRARRLDRYAVGLRAFLKQG